MSGNIKKLYTYYGKYNNQQQYKYITESVLVSTPERFTYNSTISPGTYVTVRNPSAIKPLRLFTEVLYVKKKTVFRQVGAAKSKRKAIISGTVLWSSIPKRKVHTKPNKRVNKYLYNWILHHP